MKLIAPAAMRAAAMKSGMVLKPPKGPKHNENLVVSKVSQGLTKAERQRQERKATHDLLREHWPRLFSWACPLAIGIHNDIQVALGDQVSAKELSAFLGYWCRRPAYFDALNRGEPRRKLDGSLAPPPPGWVPASPSFGGLAAAPSPGEAIG